MSVFILQSSLASLLAHPLTESHSSPWWLTGWNGNSPPTGAIRVASKLSLFLAELRRRKVYRVAAIYAAVGVAISLAVPDLFGALLLPDWAARLVIVFIVIGFPVALVMAWALELTPQGVVKAGGNNMPIYIVAAVLTLISLYWYFGKETQPATEPATATMQSELPAEVIATAAPPSLAVIPFQNMSMSDANEPFTVGIHDDLLTQLSKIRFTPCSS